MPNTNSSKNADPVNNEESHVRQFTGTWAPVTLHDLVESGELPALAAWLAMVVDSLSKGKKRVCDATNSYLGKKIHKEPRQVQRLLEKLEEKGMLKSEWRNGKRCLWVTYCCDSKDTRKDTQTNGLTHVKSDVLNKRTHVKSDVPPHVKSDVHSKEGISKEECRHPLPNGRGGDGICGTSRLNEKSPDKEVSYKLRDILFKYRKIDDRTSLHKWDHWSKKLLGYKTKDHVLLMLDVYDQNFHNKFRPDIFCTKSLYEKFARLEAFVSRLKDQEEVPTPQQSRVKVEKKGNKTISRFTLDWSKGEV